MYKIKQVVSNHNNKDLNKKIKIFQALGIIKIMKNKKLINKIKIMLDRNLFKQNITTKWQIQSQIRQIIYKV